MLYIALAYGFLIGCEEAMADALGEYLEKFNLVVDPPEVGGDSHPYA